MNNMSIAMGKRQLVDSIWKSAGIEGLGTTFPNTEKILSNLPVQTRRDFYCKYEKSMVFSI